MSATTRNQVERVSEEMVIGPFRLTATGIDIARDSNGQPPPFEDWQSAFHTVCRLESALLWWIGDLLNYGERSYGETYTQAMDATGLAYQTLANAKWVASKVEFSRRRENLTFAHHAEVAPLEPADQDRLLTIAHHEGLTRAGLRQAIRDERDGGAEEKAEVYCPFCGRPMPERTQAEG